MKDEKKSELVVVTKTKDLCAYVKIAVVKVCQPNYSLPSAIRFYSYTCLMCCKSMGVVVQ